MTRALMVHAECLDCQWAYWPDEHQQDSPTNPATTKARKRARAHAERQHHRTLVHHTTEYDARDGAR